MTDVKQGTVLVVDDEEGVLHLIGALLKKEGYEVLTADSGYRAYSMMEKMFTTLGGLKIDLIIVDWVMQGWDGIKLLTEIRLRPYGAMPVILMSGAVTREKLEAAAKNRAEAVLIKPIDKEALLKKVQDAISRSRKLQNRS